MDASPNQNFSVTERAAKRIKAILATESADAKLRVSVSGGGCSGFQYGFTFDTHRDQDDTDLSLDVPVLVDAVSLQYLQGAVIDFRDDALGTAFVIENPMAVSTCGCGSSFSV